MNTFILSFLFVLGQAFAHDDGTVNLSSGGSQDPFGSGAIAVVQEPFEPQAGTSFYSNPFNHDILSELECKTVNATDSKMVYAIELTEPIQSIESNPPVMGEANRIVFKGKGLPGMNELEITCYFLYQKVPPTVGDLFFVFEFISSNEASKYVKLAEVNQQAATGPDAALLTEFLLQPQGTHNDASNRISVDEIYNQIPYDESTAGIIRHQYIGKARVGLGEISVRETLGQKLRITAPSRYEVTGIKDGVLISDSLGRVTLKDSGIHFQGSLLDRIPGITNPALEASLSFEDPTANRVFEELWHLRITGKPGRGAYTYLGPKGDDGKYPIFRMGQTIGSLEFGQNAISMDLK